MSRKPLIAGNWKMNNGVYETEAFLAKFKSFQIPNDVEVLICPPFTSLYPAAKLLGSTKIKLGAQNVFWEDKGAFTGEVSPVMLEELGVSYVIVGHSERRTVLKETDDMVNRKIKAALRHHITPVVCVGETLEQRDAGRAKNVVTGQVKAAVKGLSPDQVAGLVIAYEPLWAIGSGRSASAEDAGEIMGVIREYISDDFDEEASDDIRILYGGSVKPDNIAEFMSQKGIDGALVGGASLKPDDFFKLANFKKRRN
jgi:triosephosphate isomerase